MSRAAQFTTSRSWWSCGRAAPRYCAQLLRRGLRRRGRSLISTDYDDTLAVELAVAGVLAVSIVACLFARMAQTVQRDSSKAASDETGAVHFGS